MTQEADRGLRGSSHKMQKPFCLSHPSTKSPQTEGNHLSPFLFIYVLLMFVDGTNARSFTQQAVIYRMLIWQESNSRCSANVFINQSFYYLDLIIRQVWEELFFFFGIFQSHLASLPGLFKQTDTCSTQFTNYFNCKTWTELTLSKTQIFLQESIPKHQIASKSFAYGEQQGQ